MHATVTYQIAERSYGDLPLESIFQWAVKHRAVESFLKLLNETIFNWGNVDISCVIYFCGPNEGRKDFSHDQAREKLDLGDIVVVYSHTDKQYDYRKDRVRVYCWRDDENEGLGWREAKDYDLFYARKHPFGPYTKPMTSEWGYKRLPPIMLGTW